MRAPSALAVLATELREERTVISAHVVEAREAPALGPLAAAGPRAAGAESEYALVLESIREGYLLHYGLPRILAGHDPDLALLAGDYLYARGIERLAALGDGVAVAELSDLISIAAECHAEGRGELSAPLWLATAVAVGCGPSADHRAAKDATRRLAADAGGLLRDAARSTAASADLLGELDRVAEAIDLRASRVDASG
jgi:hypothetical protein